MQESCESLGDYVRLGAGMFNMVIDVCLAVHTHHALDTMQGSVLTLFFLTSTVFKNQKN